MKPRTVARAVSRNEESGHENAIIMLGYYIIILPGCKGKKHNFVEIPGEALSVTATPCQLPHRGSQDRTFGTVPLASPCGGGAPEGGGEGQLANFSAARTSMSSVTW